MQGHNLDRITISLKELSTLIGSNADLPKAVHYIMNSSAFASGSSTLQLGLYNVRAH